MSREIDELVAERVMGVPSWMPTPRYSTDIAQAWLVVEHVRKQGRKVVYALVDQLDRMADTADTADPPPYRARGIAWFVGECKNPAEAICLAALRYEQEEYDEA